ncbi:MAG: cutinase family protein, partial [Janthinobacterium lividum]
MGNVFENVTRTTLRQARKRKRTSIAATAVAVVAAGLAGLSTTSTFAAAPPASGCAAVETIVVRGTGETPKAPYIGKQEVPLVSAISTGAAATVETYGLPYPASVTGTLVGGDYSQSQPVGRTDLQARIASQAAACPDQKFVLVGYSQGAWVVGDVLAGSGIAPLSATLGAKVAAVVLYGDPFFNAKESFNRGTFTAGVSSPNPRRTGALAAYASRIADFCNSTDQICQKGATGTGHDHYLDTYTAEAAKFVTALLPQPATPTPTATTAPVVTPTTAPVATPTAPVATATTAPVATATTAPVVTATAEPVVTATAEPVVTATAEPVVTATAEPVVTATAEPVVT